MADDCAAEPDCAMEHDAALHEAKLRNVRNWVHTQSLDIPPSSHSDASETNLQSKSDRTRSILSEEHSQGDETSRQETATSQTPSAASDDSSPVSFDFEKFPDENKTEGSSPATSFLSVDEQLQKPTAASNVSSNHGSCLSDTTVTALRQLNQRLGDLGYGTVDLLHSSQPELLNSVGNKLLVVLDDVRQKSEMSNALLQEAKEWQSKEQSLTTTIKSLKLRLEESDRVGSSTHQAHFRDKEASENTIKSLQDAKKKLEIENNKLSNACTSLKHKQNELYRSLDLMKAQVKTHEDEKEKLKDRIRELTEKERQQDKRREDAQKQQKILENSMRLKDSELCKLRSLHESITAEKQILHEKHAQTEKALRDQEKENLLLKKTLQSGPSSQELKKALASATEDAKRLKEDLSIERSKRNASERKCEKLTAELKTAHHLSKEHERSIRAKENNIFEMELEIKRLKLNEIPKLSDDVNREHAKQMQEFKKEVDHLGSENRELNRSVGEMTQKCRFLQKENLQLDAKRLQAEKKIRNCNSEVARLTDDLTEKNCELREANGVLAETEKSLSASESHATLHSESSKEKEIETLSLKKSNSNLIASKCSLEHKVLQLETTCERLREKLREKIAREEKRTANEKEAYKRLKANATSDRNVKLDLRRGDVFQFCERKILELSSDMDSLQQQNTSYTSQLKTLENELMGYKRTESALQFPPDKLKNRLRLAEKSITDLSAKLMLTNESKSEAIGQIRQEKESLEMRNAEQKHTIRRLQQRLHQPHPELAAAQKQIKALGSKIQTQTKENTAIQLFPKQRSGLGLSLVQGPHSLDKMPRPHIERILKSLCMMMDIYDPSLLVDRTLKLLKVVGSLPKVEKFVSDVCDAVLCKGAAFVPHHLKPSSSRMVGEGDVTVLVPSILKYWVEQFS